MQARKTRGLLLNAALIAAALLFVIGIAYFGYLMVMRAQWQYLKNDIADAINSTPAASQTMSFDGEVLPFIEQDELYFSKFLSSPYLIPIKAGEMQDTGRSLIISLGNSRLVFTPGKDETVIHIQLDTPDGSNGFYARSPLDYSYLERYFSMRVKYPQ